MAWAQCNGVSLRYVREGNAQSPRLVLVHEMGGCLESWDGVVPLLARSHSTLRFDQRGAGLSEKPRAAFSIDDLVADLCGLLDAVGWSGPVAFAGCAVGAAVALRLAARHPARVSAVVAMAPATGLSAQKVPDTLQLADRLEREGVRARITERFDHSYAPRYFVNEAERAQALGRLLAQDPHGYAQTYRMLCTLDMQDDLPRIRCPVLVLAGQHDGTRPPAGVEAVAASIPGARFGVLDSGHVMPVLVPRLVAEAITMFLADPTGPAFRAAGR